MQLARSILAAGVLFFLLFQGVAHAFETRFAIDPAVNLRELERTGAIVAKMHKQRDVYLADASAVLAVDPAKIYQISAEFERYAPIDRTTGRPGMKMPGVRESRIVERSGADVLYTWTKMSMSGRSSEHYLEVRFVQGLTPTGAVGTQWQLSPKRRHWPYGEDSAFERLEGSWYVEPLASGKVYVRYFLFADLDTRLPGFLVDMIAKNQFKNGVEEIIRILAREAATRP